MINSKKLSLFRNGNPNSIGLTDISVEITESKPMPTLSLNKETIAVLIDSGANNDGEKELERSRIFGGKFCIRRVRRSRRRQHDDPDVGDGVCDN